jgi:hypothetical protein
LGRGFFNACLASSPSLGRGWIFIELGDVQLLTGNQAVKLKQFVTTATIEPTAKGMCQDFPMKSAR